MNPYYKKFFLSVMLLTCLFFSLADSFVVNVYDMVGKSSSTFAHTTVPLPSVVKSNSNWVPLCKIDISTDTSASYEIKGITITIKNVTNFDFFRDLSEIKIFEDDKNGDITINSTTTWDGSSVESIKNVNPTLVSSGTFGGVVYYKIYFYFATGIPVNRFNRWFTIYPCIKTSADIQNQTQFALRNSAGDIVINISDNNITPTLPTFTTLTADTLPPQLVASYTLNPTSGTTLTVYNYDTYNIYTTTTDAGNNLFANNTIDLKIKLTEDNNSLSNNGIVNLNDLVILDTTEIDANNQTNYKSITYIGNNEFRITYTIIQTTINSPTVAVPLKIKVKDAAGNETSWDDSFRCFIDRSKPTPPVITSPQDNAWVNENYPQLSWQASTEDNIYSYYLVFSTCNIVEDWWYNTDRGYYELGNVLYSYWGDQSIWKNNYPTAGTDEYYWAVAVQDKAGNINISQPRKFKFDNVNPSGYNPNPVPNSLLSYSTPTISIDVDDALNGTTLSGIDFNKTKMYINNIEVVFSTAEVNTTTATIRFVPPYALPDGQNNVKVYLYDKVGNNVQYSWNFYIDTTKPESKDTDNDGYSDQDEILSGTNPNDPFSYPAKPKGFWPLNEMVVNSNYIFNGATITLRLDDIKVNNFSSGLDVIFTTSSVTDKIVVYHLTKGTTENWVYLPSRSWVGSSSATICIQLVRPFATNGSDDGEIQVKYKVKDNAGNIGDLITRKFYYDTTPPVISTVSAPLQTGSETPTDFVISVNDNIGVSDKAGDVKFCVWINGNLYEYNMTPQSSNQWKITKTFSDISGTVNYYFVAKDKAGNATVYPPGADNDYSNAIPLLITDQTPPKITIYQIKTLQNYTVTGITTTYTSTGTGALGIKTGVPVVYQAPNNDNVYNIILATVPPEAVSVTFQYKLSTGTQWNSIACTKTLQTVGGNPVWEASFNAIGLPTGVYYDIRFVAVDGNNNVYIPQDISDNGYAKIYLLAPLQPKLKIDTANQRIVKDGNVINYNKVLLNATVAGNNLDVTSAKFQYKRTNESDWKDIGIDNLTSGTTVTFVLKSSELPYLEYRNSVKISSIIYVTLDFTSGANCDNYDKVMTKIGNDWYATVYFTDVDTYTYQYKITTPEGDKILQYYDPRRYIVSIIVNRIPVSKFSYEWDLSNLPYGEYQIRAVAKDKFGIEDTSPETITLSYLPVTPQKPVITLPVNGQKFKPSTTCTIYSSVPETDTYVSYVLFQYSEDAVNWINLFLDTNKSDGWSYSFNIPSTLSEKRYYFRTISFTEPMDVSPPSDVVYITADPQPPQILSFSVLDGTTPVVMLESGKTYNIKVETLDTDISTVTISLSSNISGSLSPNNGVAYTISGGKGTTNEPYYYLFAFTLPSNINNTAGTITVTVYDLAGNSVSKTLSVQVVDVTPSIAVVTAYSNDGGNSWIYTTDSSFGYIGRNGAIIRVSVLNLDGGTVKLQFSSSPVGPWVTIGEKFASSTVGFTWQPLSNNVAEGVYYIRAVSVDNDNNVDPAPQVVPVRIDYSIPKITSLTVSPSGVIDCSKEFTVYAKTDDNDVKNITLQYLDPANNANNSWVTITETTSGRLLALVKSNITPNNVGLTETSWVCIAPNISQPTTLKLRAFAVDRANNYSYEPEFAPQVELTFNDTTPPVAVVYNTGDENVYAQTSDANVKSILFQYRVASAGQSWIDLGVTNIPSSTYGNVGKIWISPVTLANLPAGTYELRAVATDMFNNVDATKSPISTVVIQVNTVGVKSYNPKKSMLTVGVKDVKFDDVGGVELNIEVKSQDNFITPPEIKLLIKDSYGNTVTRTVTTNGVGNSFTGIVKLDNLARGNNTVNIWLSAEGTTVTGSVGEIVALAISYPSTSPNVTTEDGFASISCSGLSKVANAVVLPAVAPPVPQQQTALLKPAIRCYDFRLSDGTKQLPSGSYAQVTMKYTDADITGTGIDETKLGIAYWDEEKQIWSSEGISNVTLDIVNNNITFRTNHLSIYAIMEINSVPEIVIESPKENSYTDKNPLISVKAIDKFSGIRQIKVVVDGIDYTNTAINIASSDGVDNNLDGRIDEQGGSSWDTTDDEQAFNIISPTAARFITKLPLNLKEGEHTLTVVVQNQQGQSSTKTVKFKTSPKLDFAAEPFNYPNPFNPQKTSTIIVPNLTKSANVTVNIYDVAGDKVATLGPKTVHGTGLDPVNTFEWNGTEDNSKKYLADGIYFAEILADDGVQKVRKFVKIAITSK